MPTREEGAVEAYYEENQGGSQDDLLSTRSQCLKIPRSDISKLNDQAGTTKGRATYSDAWFPGGLVLMRGKC